MLILNLIYGQSINASLTMYKNGFTMVKQPIFWNISERKNHISYSLIPNQLYPETPFLSLEGNEKIISQRLNNNIFSSERYFKSHLGSNVEIYPKNGKYVDGILVEFNSKSITIQDRSWIKMIPRDELAMISVKDKLNDVQFRPKLEWEIEGATSEFIRGSLLYMTGGITWKAVYRLITSSNGESAQLVSEALVSNDTDLDFADSQLKLVEGDLNKASVHRPVKYASPLMQGMRVQEESKNNNVGEVPLGDYYVYPISDNISLAQGETMTLTLYPERDISFKRTYIFENRERQKKEEPLEVEIEIANTEGNNLSIPLPAGKVEIYLNTPQGNVEFIGEDNIRQTPKGEKAKIIAGRAFDVIGKRKVVDYDRQRKSEEASIEIEVMNKKRKAVEVKIIEHINGDWVIKNTNKQYIKEDVGTIYFPVTIPADDSKIILYTYKKEWK